MHEGFANHRRELRCAFTVKQKNGCKQLEQIVKNVSIVRDFLLNE
jgi:hypothetical protein